MLLLSAYLLHRSHIDVPLVGPDLHQHRGAVLVEDESRGVERNPASGLEGDAALAHPADPDAGTDLKGYALLTWDCDRGGRGTIYADPGPGIERR